MKIIFWGTPIYAAENLINIVNFPELSDCLKGELGSNTDIIMKGNNYRCRDNLIVTQL